MTDLVLVAVLGTMAGLLGAAVLAIALLYRGWKSNRAQITELRAQLATAQIAAALAGQRPPTTDGGAPAPATPEPARRKRHLALYVGGGVVAAFVSCREGLRNLVRSHSAATAVAAVATVGTAAALVLAPSGDPGRPVPGLPGGTAGLEPEALQDTQAANERPDGDEHQEDEPNDGTPAHELTDQGRGSVALAPPTPDASDTATAAPQDGQAPRQEPSPAPPVAQEPPAAEDPEDAPPPAAPPKTDPDPAVPAPEPEDDRSGLCLDVPPLVDLCLLTGR